MRFAGRAFNGRPVECRSFPWFPNRAGEGAKCLTQVATAAQIERLGNDRARLHHAARLVAIVGVTLTRAAGIRLDKKGRKRVFKNPK
jgi:hypothetical protein